MGKAYAVLVRNTGVVLRYTGSVQHAVKHAALASELRISVEVRDNRKGDTVITLDAIDKTRAIRPACKRDRRYARKARKAVRRLMNSQTKRQTKKFSKKAK